MKKKKQSDYYYIFSEGGSIEKAKEYPIWDLHKKAIEKPEELTTDDKAEIFSEIQAQGQRGTSVRIMGVMLNFKPVLKRFWVKYKDYEIIEIYSPSKMNIRKDRYTNRGIVEIMGAGKWTGRKQNKET